MNLCCIFTKNKYSICSTPPTIQKFSIPENIIFYIAKNPKSFKVYNILVKTCKYFFLKNPVTTLKLEMFSKWKLTNINGIICEYEVSKTQNLPEKMWIFDWLVVKNKLNKNTASSLVPKIYRNDITRLHIVNQILSFDELKALSSSIAITEMTLAGTIIKKDDGNIVAVEMLIENLSNLLSFTYSNNQTDKYEWNLSITEKTAANLREVSHFNKLRYFILKNIPETFEIENFCKDLKGQSFILLYFDVVSEDYKQRLQSVVNKIIKDGLTENRPVYIEFHGENPEKKAALMKLRDDYAFSISEQEYFYCHVDHSLFPSLI